MFILLVWQILQSAGPTVQETGGVLPSGELWDASAAPGIGLLEHVNLYVGDSEGDRENAEAFYFGLLGLVPDPRLPGQYRKIVADAAGVHALRSEFARHLVTYISTGYALCVQMMRRKIPRGQQSRGAIKESPTHLLLALMI